MPRIKLKNIPFRTQYRICKGNKCDSQCPFYVYEDAIPVFMNDCLGGISLTLTCIRDARYDPGEKTIELSEKDFPTNREWLEACPASDLAKFYTSGLQIERDPPFSVNIEQILGNFMSSEIGIREWLSQPCEYLMEEE